MKAVQNVNYKRENKIKYLRVKGATTLFWQRMLTLTPVGSEITRRQEARQGTHAANVSKGQTVKKLMSFKMSFKVRKIIALIKGKFLRCHVGIYLRCVKKLLVYFHAAPSFPTCCKVWRKSPSLHPARWCEWHRSQLAGCWSRSGSRRGWSSSGETSGTRSTASPEHVAIRLGRSYTPSPPAETPPGEAKHWLHLSRSRFYLYNDACSIFIALRPERERFLAHHNVLIWGFITS